MPNLMERWDLDRVKMVEEFGQGWTRRRSPHPMTPF